jgi:diguanylate cyclase (GGDEF)-like protein
LDVAARYGGEEFCMLLPDTDAASAEIIAERIRKGIEGMAIEYEGQKMSITLSLGVAQYDPNRDLAGKSVIDRADKAMYLSKQSGRNRVMVAR